MRNSLSQNLRLYPPSVTACAVPAPPRGRLLAMPESLPSPPKAVPLGKVAANEVSRRKGCCSRLNLLSPLPLVASRFPYLSLRDIFPRPGEVFPLRGSFFALPESLWFCRILCRNRKSSPFRGSWHRAAMTERVFPRSHFFYQSVTFRFVLFVVYYGQHGSPWQH